MDSQMAAMEIPLKIQFRYQLSAPKYLAVQAPRLLTMGHLHL
jgi:hypothetical protein